MQAPLTCRLDHHPGQIPSPEHVKPAQQQSESNKRGLSHLTDISISQPKRIRLQSNDQIRTAKPLSRNCNLVGRERSFKGSAGGRVDHYEEENSDEEESSDEEDDSDEGSSDESTGDENAGYQNRIGPCYKCKDFNPLPKTQVLAMLTLD